MTLIPAVLVLLVGSELIRNSVDRWFNAPMDEILDSAQRIASDYYHERQRQVSDEAARIARALAHVDLAAARRAPGARRGRARGHRPERVTLVEVYRALRVPGADRRGWCRWSTWPSPTVPRRANRASSDRLAARALRRAARRLDRASRSSNGGELIRAAAVVRRPDGRRCGVVVATVHLTGSSPRARGG